MKMLKNWKIKDNIIKVIKTYPVVLCSIILIGILGIISIHSEIDDDIIAKINFSIAIFAGFSLILRALKLSYDNFDNKKYLIILIICLLLSAGYYFTIDMQRDWTIQRTFIILFIQGLLFISLPFIKDDEKSEHFVNTAAGRLVISGVLFGIAYGGVAGILFALEELFGLDISEKIYQDAAIILSTTFLPMLWLFGLNYKTEPFTSRLYKVLLCYVCIPLLFVYSAVVYGFIAKIVIDGFVMPSSIIGNLVLWYSFASIVVTYLARPYEENSLTKFFYKWYPLISVLPIVIMFIAIFMRIRQYSLTINRYYLLLGGIWLAVMFGYLVFARFAKKKRKNIVITLSIALFALISILEPVSAYTISENAQINRLKETIEQYKESGGEFSASNMADEDIRQAQDIIYYLQWQHSYRFSDGSDMNSYGNLDFLTEEQIQDILSQQVNYEIADDDTNYGYVERGMKGFTAEPLDISEYNYLINIQSYDFNNGDIYAFKNYEIKIEDISGSEGERKDNIIYIYKDKVLVYELSMLECYGERIQAKGNSFGNSASDFIYVTEDEVVKIVISNMDYRFGKEVAITYFNAELFFK